MLQHSWRFSFSFSLRFLWKSLLGTSPSVLDRIEGERENTLVN